MPKRTRKYEESLVDALREPAEAAAYLNARLEREGKDGDALFLLALRDIAKAYGVGHVASKTKLGRESLYKALSAKGNPRLSTLSALLDAVGLKLSVLPKTKRRPTA